MAAEANSPKRVLLVWAHPSGGSRPSYVGALADAVTASLASAGHQVRVSNLYEQRFQAALSAEEHRDYLTAYRQGKVSRDLETHVRDIRWCSALVLVYPTWWYSLPAVLKGWLDRTLLPGVAFDLPKAHMEAATTGAAPAAAGWAEGEGTASKGKESEREREEEEEEEANEITGLIARLTNIRKLGVVTTYGNTEEAIKTVGDPGRLLLTRGIRALMHKDCQVVWRALYDVEACSREAREAFIEEVGRDFSTF